MGEQSEPVETIEAALVSDDPETVARAYAVRARRTQMSVLQSLLNAERAEAEFVRVAG